MYNVYLSKCPTFSTKLGLGLAKFNGVKHSVYSAVSGKHQHCNILRLMGFGVKENYLISVTNSLIMVKVNIMFYSAGTSLDEVLRMQWPVQQVVPDLF